MDGNPYKSPESDERTSPARRSKSLCIRGLLTAVACLIAGVAISAIWRFGEEGPATHGRRIAAGVMLLLNVGMYAGVITAVVNGMFWAVRRRD